MAKNKSGKTNKRKVETILHEEASRAYIPTAEYEAVVREEDKRPIVAAYQRRNPDLDPQLVWRGKDVLDWSDLVLHAPPLYIQEKVHPKVLIDDLMRETEARKAGKEPEQLDLFTDFNGLANEAAKTEFYQHEANWTNRMILGDSLQVMASLAEREGLRGKVQCIYVDPPYGIKFNSNFQWSTTSHEVKDGKLDQITREPEQVRAFRDTWRDGVHSYLSYLRDRLTVAAGLMANSGSVFVQMGDENMHLVRSLMDEIFGPDNFVAVITFQTAANQNTQTIQRLFDHLIWYARDIALVKVRKSYRQRSEAETAKVFSRRHSEGWQYRSEGLDGVSDEIITRLGRAGRVVAVGKSVAGMSLPEDFPVREGTNVWTDTVYGHAKRFERVYAVQTNSKVIERCILLTTDPGDLVVDPTCGGGTTAWCAEKWGRRWITIDTSRVALALTRARIMGARYPYYLLADSRDGQRKLAEVTGKVSSDAATSGRIRQGFVYERVPHITFGSIASNAAIDAIWEKWQPAVQHALEDLKTALRGHPSPFKNATVSRAGRAIDFSAQDGKTMTMPSGEKVPANGFVEWEVPKDAPRDWPSPAAKALKAFWTARNDRQNEIDASIAASAEYEYLYDKPYEDPTKVRVAGPFTVESLAPHRALAVDENDGLVDPQEQANGGTSFVEMILENLKTAGVQQAHKEDRIGFLSIVPWPGTYVCAEGRYIEGGRETGAEKRAAIFIGPEFGTVSRPDLVAAAREAADAGFDVLVACAFSYDAQSTEFSNLGKVPVLKARMNADLHMAKDLKRTSKGNLFVIFGEPDIDLLQDKDGKMKVKIIGVDVFDPTTGDVRSDNADGIACWFIDTNYNEESFFVRHAYFLGANDPYQSLKTSLKAEINREAWESLHSDVSRPFEKPSSGRIAVKVINHLGDEVMKVFRID